MGLSNPEILITMSVDINSRSLGYTIVEFSGRLQKNCTKKCKGKARLKSYEPDLILLNNTSTLDIVKGSYRFFAC